MKLKIPEPYVFIFALIVFCGMASYIIPAGTNERQLDVATGINRVVAGSYHAVPQTPVTPFEILKAIPQGMVQAADLIFFVLIVGGSLGVLQATGIINAMIKSVGNRLRGREKWFIPIFMLVFSLMGAILGSVEELLAFLPFVIVLAIKLGFDEITAVAVVFVGSVSGYTAGFLNPYSTGIAQNMSGLPLFSGIGYRIVCFLVILACSIAFVLLKSRKLTRNNVDGGEEKTCTSGFSEMMDQDEDFEIKNRNKYFQIKIILGISLCTLVFGVLHLGFRTMEFATVYLIMGIAIGIVYRFRSGRIVGEFINGASSILYGALIIGLARGIMVVMNDGQIVDTIIFWLSKAIDGFSPMISAILIYCMHTVLSIFLVSSSGEAAVTLPILVNIADASNITRQTAVLAYQFGDGFMNIFTPMSGVFMAALAIGGISWKKWIKWSWPLLVLWFFLGVVLIVISVYIKYGPF